MADSLFGWTVWASMPSLPRVDEASGAVAMLDHIADARIDRIERGPALADERAAVDWLTHRSSEHARSITNVGGFVARRIPIVLLFAGGTPEDAHALSVADLTAYLASPACVGFAVAEPRARHAPRVLRMAGALVLGALVLAAGVLLTVADRSTTQQEEMSGLTSADKHREPAAKHGEAGPDADPAKASETAEDSGASDEAAVPAVGASVSASASTSAAASASTAPSPASTR